MLVLLVQREKSVTEQLHHNHVLWDTSVQQEQNQVEQIVQKTVQWDHGVMEQMEVTLLIMVATLRNHV